MQLTTKTSLIIAIIGIITITGCDIFSNDSDSNGKKDYPKEFPLEVGNAWKYERNYYENGNVDTSFIDTLYIAGKYEDYYHYTWDPKDRRTFVKNTDNMLVAYGSISISNDTDTTFFDTSTIWAFYSREGAVNIDTLKNYSIYADSVYINKVEKEFSGEMYKSYQQKFIRDEGGHSIVTVSKLGIMELKYFDNEGNLYDEHILSEELEDVEIPSLNMNTKSKLSDSLNLTQTIRNYRPNMHKMR